MDKTKIVRHDISGIPQISFDDNTLEVVDNFTYLGLNILSKSIMERELNICIGEASTAMVLLAKGAWCNAMIMMGTKMKV